MAYLTQAEASVYSDTLGTLTQTKADALLQVASDMVDAFCGRTFDVVLEELPSPVAMAVSLWAEELVSGTQAGRDKIREKIGDYEVAYEADSGSQMSYAPPSIVATLLTPYRIIVVG